MDNNEFELAIDKAGGPEDLISVSAALFSSWVEAEMCKPVLQVCYTHGVFSRGGGKHTPLSVSWLKI